MSASSLADDKSPSGSALRALRATLSALMPKARSAPSAAADDAQDEATDGDDGDNSEDDDHDNANDNDGEAADDVGVSMTAAMHAGAVAAYTTALFKGQSAAQAVGIAQRVSHFFAPTHDGRGNAGSRQHRLSLSLSLSLSDANSPYAAQ